MAADAESMSYTRQKPWHGFGTRVEEAPSSADALRLAGLGWKVLQEPICIDNTKQIESFVIAGADCLVVGGEAGLFYIILKCGEKCAIMFV